MRPPTPWTRLQGLLFYAAMALFLATQSRRLLGGAGLGDLAGMAFVLVSLPRRSALPTWVQASLLMLVSGFLVGTTANQLAGWSQIVSLRDLFALVFALAFASAAIEYLQTCACPELILARALSAAMVVQVLPLMLLAAGVQTDAWLTDSDLPGIPFLSRYTGFSDNPNQLGMLLCAFPFVAAAGLRVRQSRLSKAFLIFSILAFLPIAVFVKSNTVFSAYIIGGSVWVVLQLNQWTRPPRERTDTQLRMALTVCLMLVAVVAFALYAGESVKKTDDGDANGRFPLWLHAAQGVAQSFFLGVGAGGQSGDLAPFQGSEAHNQLLDFTLQGGLMAVSAYLLLLWGSAREILRRKSTLCACVFTAIVVEQLTHYTARQPISWVYIMLIFALIKPVGVPQAARAQTLSAAAS